MNDRNGQGPKRLPSHRLCVQHTEDSKFTTEVGALWPHSKGGGFSVTIKPGISLGPFVDGARLVAFEIDHEARDERRGSSDSSSDRARGERDSRGGSRR